MTDIPDVVTLGSLDGDCFPEPSRELLVLHAVCCNVARESGAAKYLDEGDLDIEFLDGVLASDEPPPASHLYRTLWKKLKEHNQE